MAQREQHPSLKSPVADEEIMGPVSEFSLQVPDITLITKRPEETSRAPAYHLAEGD